MRFCFGKQDMRTLDRAQENTFLLTNGLGGYASVTAAYSVPRSDQGVLVAAVKAPNERINMVHRLSETLQMGEKEMYLSSQRFADDGQTEDGYRRLAAFSYEDTPLWLYEAEGVRVSRTLAMAYEKNATAVIYTIDNRSDQDCTLRIEPFFKFAPKEEAVTEQKEFTYDQGCVKAGTYCLYINTDGHLEKTAPRWQLLAYTEDAKDGRPDSGMTGSCCQITKTAAAGETLQLEVVFSMEPDSDSGEAILKEQRSRLGRIREESPLTDPVARQLTVAADAYIARRDSTDGKTILAGYPLFSDWGRDTMIALTGCTLSTGRYEDAKSILRTFLAYERNGLVPNLFPEGGAKPMYNTVDAALLLIDSIWQYHKRTGDLAFVKEAYPVMERIVTMYRQGTDHAIGMDEDGLIHAGDGLDQVTWMDVCVQGILPTPRHGKPVEINAYWYNALCIMDALAEQLGCDRKDYRQLAQQVKQSFVEKFYIEDKGYLKDVLSGTSADEQIRCNQIWAVSMPFTMLSAKQEKQVVETVYRHLYTPCGLRTLSPTDPEYHPFYGGDQVKRDMAYHQGTTWVFPQGAYYRAYLKVNGYKEEAVKTVRQQLEALEPMLREGCVGQLPEIYDGDFPTEGKGCFAQAWSVGEILRVYEELQSV